MDKKIQWCFNLEEKGENSGRKTKDWFDTQVVGKDLTFSDPSLYLEATKRDV